ncbi:hypothetical protein [Shimazuella kribbensis]|uniref:hypothetical protein n=1 Tax=Shimazuella kribbensis TaxID=139808 RepID=UPI0004280759|nr:hypothetical protein [Shimazuella kribbensis]
MMKKGIMSFGLGCLTFIFAFVVQFNIASAASTSCSINGGNNKCTTGSVQANSENKVSVYLDNHNNIDVTIEVIDTKNGKVVKKHTMYDKGSYFVHLNKVYSTYKVKLYCDDSNPFNDDKCNAQVSIES